MNSAQEDTGRAEWYVSGAHARRAVGYLSAALAERDALPENFPSPVLLDLWGDALLATELEDDYPPSPIGVPT
jgi:hypothetical protein